MSITFEEAQIPVTVTVNTDNGFVSATQPMIAGDIENCTNDGGVCVADYPPESLVELTATPTDASYLTVWSGVDASGNCSANTCTFSNLASAKSVAVSFLPVEIFNDGFEIAPR